MKKIYILSSMLLATSVVFAQTPRKMLVEHFTQASCGPCASYNPSLKTMLDNTTEDVVAVKYQTSWPGTDPMNAHNPGEIQTRVSYYGVSGVPNPIFEGNVVDGTGLADSDLTTRGAVTSPFEITLSHDYDEGLDSVKVTMKIKATGAASTSANFVAHIAVVEEEINFPMAPGSNGERIFYNVMKKMLPNANGTSLGNSFSIGDSVIIEESWVYKNVYDMDEIAVVGWVQDGFDKEVMQSGHSPKKPFVAKNLRDVAVREVYDQPRSSCSGDYNATILIRHNGSENLTSLNVNYSVNGGSVTTIPWSGNLSFMETAEIDIPISHTVGANDDITISISEANGVPDGNIKNDYIDFNMSAAKNHQNYIFVTIQLDEQAYETRWEIIRNSTGDVVVDGGPYFGQNGEKIEKLFIAEDGECYDFKIYDSNGDGLEGGSYYRLRAGNGTYILSGNAFKSVDGASFIGDESLPLSMDTTGLTSINELEDVEFSLNPNPAFGNVDIKLPLGSNGMIEIYNALGEVVLSKNVNKSMISMNVEQFKSGIYFVKFNSKNRTFTRKLVKN